MEQGKILTNQKVLKEIMLMVVYGTAIAFGILAYDSYRYNNVTRINVSMLAGLDEAFEVGPSGLRARNPTQNPQVREQLCPRYAWRGVSDYQSLNGL